MAKEKNKVRAKATQKESKPVKNRKALVKKPKNKKKIAKNIKKYKKTLKNKIVAKKKKPVKKKLVLKKKKSVKRNPRKAKSILAALPQSRRRRVWAVSKNAKPKEKKSPEFAPEALFKARIKVSGVGGGGGSIVSEIGKSLDKATFVIADTDIRALKKRAGIKYFWFGEDLTRGLGTGVNIDLAKQAAEAAKEKISDTFKDQDIIIFIASLGGGLGSGATQVFAEAAKKYGAITFGIFTMPFKFEGKNKTRIAQNALKSLRQSLNVSLIIPNEKIFKIIDESTPITAAFSVVNKSLINSLESLIDLIYSPGIINIDFADLRTILKGRGNAAFLNTVEESGKNRADKICERVFLNPLLQGGALNAEKILFNIAGSDNLSMFEVEKVSSHIARLNPNAKIIFGISKNLKLKNKIKTTILMTGGGAKESEKLATEHAVAAVGEVSLPEKPALEPRERDKKKKKKKPKTKKSKYKKKPLALGKKSDAPQEKNEQEAPFLAPSFAPAETVASGESPKRMSVVETTQLSAKKAIRRSGIEIKKAEELEEKKRIAQEREWEIPAFLRKVKFNK